ncbi:Hint domain-containing protein, partial [Acetobacter thailandicus]
NVISGGTWVAKLNNAGQTVYVSGTKVVSGPVNLWNASLTISSGAVVSGLVSVATFGLGNGTLTVLSGGTIESSYVANGPLNIYSGGSSLSNSYESEVTTVYSGGSSTDDVFTESYDGGYTSGTLNGSKFAGGDNTSYVNVLNGGYISYPSISNQQFTLASSAVYNNAVSKTTPPDITNNNNVISGGTWVAKLNNAGQTVYVSGTKVVSGPVNLWNASLTISSGAVVSGLVSVATFGAANGTIYVSSGGTIESSYTANGYLNIYSGGSSLSNSYESEVTTIYSGGSSTDDVFTESYSGGYTSGTLNGSKFAGGDNTSYVLVGSGGYISNPTVVNEALTVYKTATFESSEACFLAGSLITTPSGLVPVEELSVGDQVIAYVDGVEKNRHVTWAGEGHCVIRPHLPLDQAGYPIRILKDSIADGVPFKDLLITAEHCLFFDGKFVPARMLVNGSSIFYDTSINAYKYYHIETEEHSVIMADGMLTESYLDTGNRHTFTQTGNVVSFSRSRTLSWNDAAAPLTVSRDDVELIFCQIKSRAEQKGRDVQTIVQPLVHDHNLYLVTETGATIRQIRESDGRVMFMIPAGIESVRLVSHASRPCDVIGPFVDDRRKLGVLVGSVMLCEGDTTITLTDHLQDPELSGWNNIEGETVRWTKGNALLKLGQRPMGSIALMAIDIHAGGPYILENRLPEQSAIQA